MAYPSREMYYRLSILTRSLRQFIMGLGLSLLLVYSSPLYSANIFDVTYDQHFRHSAGRFLPQYEWGWLKAQCFQESLFDARARSRAGAMGICQFMPRTWDHVTGTLGLRASPYNPRANIIAAGYYMSRLDRIWSAPRPKLKRLELAQASYNAGVGNVLKAQEKCNGALFWEDINPCLGYEETETYVQRIKRWKEQLDNE